MNDFALGAIVLMVVAAPLALALLAAFEFIRVGAALRHRSLRVAAALAAIPQFYFPAAAGTRSLLIAAGGPLASYEWQPLGQVQSVVQSAYALEVRHRQRTAGHREDHPPPWRRRRPFRTASVQGI